MKKVIIFTFMVFYVSFGFSQFNLSEGTEARFYIDEVLLGQDKTVIGVTSDVTAEINFDLSNPQEATVGSISIDASTLATDSSRRDGQIHRRVLATSQEENKFITFTPTVITGLPEAIAVGDSFNVQMVGDLTIKGTTLETSFEVMLTITSETQLNGSGSTTILYKDFNLSIPSVPSVASVEDEVKLEIEFVASR